ncbi:hypothetical protein [Bacillus sp. MMSF_3328]|uniref:hypothetical protein n=1 Tax=Bacillus sp. MMSF_3328 TaxID=3047080 RepID=UPI00273DF9D6|nr:hypothetical protein [Bacillus sp. MMSF_3328]
MKMNKYVFLAPGQKVYLSEGPTQLEAYEKLKSHLRVNDIDIIATYKVTEEIHHDVQSAF